jgi:hypothetical protein
MPIRRWVFQLCRGGNIVCEWKSYIFFLLCIGSKGFKNLKCYVLSFFFWDLLEEKKRRRYELKETQFEFLV